MFYDVKISWTTNQDKGTWKIDATRCSSDKTNSCIRIFFFLIQLLLSYSFLLLFLSYRFLVFLYGLKIGVKWLSFFQPFVCAACSSCIVVNLMFPSLLGKINGSLILQLLLGRADRILPYSSAITIGCEFTVENDRL